MKRWLIGSLALNVLLVGIAGGFLAGGMFRPAPVPPLGPPPGGPGIQRDLTAAVEKGLSGQPRDVAREIVHRNLTPLPSPPFPRPEDLLARFVEGDLPKTADILDPGMEARRRQEAEAIRKTFVELADALEQPERAALAATLAQRVAEVRACIDGSR